MVLLRKAMPGCQKTKKRPPRVTRRGEKDPARSESAQWRKDWVLNMPRKNVQIKWRP